MNQTILKTTAMLIKGRKVTVETIKGDKGRQDISYKINGVPIDSENFWELNPKFLHKYVTE